MAKIRRRKKRTHVPINADPSRKGDPKSFVFWRGRHGTALKELEGDLRRVMMPNTAPRLKESKRNSLRDFVDVAGPMGVTHFLILTATEAASYLRLAKTPRGPTMTMRVHEYALMRDVLGAQTRPRAPEAMWKGSPLVVMNNFGSGGGPEMMLASSLFSGLFPAINVRTAKLAACQRVVLLSHDPETRRISLRHYNIAATPSGVTKSVKSLIGQRRLPDMAELNDVSELLTKSGYGSESEGEEAAEARVTLPQDMGRGNIAARQSRVRLHEVGPRLELEIVKVESGLCSGEVLYHAHESRTPDQVAGQKTAHEDKEHLRAKRRREQEENVRKKEVLKKRKAEGEKGRGPTDAKRRRGQWENEPGTAVADDDIAEYRRQVGEEPDDEIGLVRPRKGGAPGKPGPSRGGGGQNRQPGGRSQNRQSDPAGSRGGHRGRPGRGGGLNRQSGAKFGRQEASREGDKFGRQQRGRSRGGRGRSRGGGGSP